MLSFIKAAVEIVREWGEPVLEGIAEMFSMYREYREEEAEKQNTVNRVLTELRKVITFAEDMLPTIERVFARAYSLIVFIVELFFQMRSGEELDPFGVQDEYDRRTNQQEAHA